jgi:Mrp family chromosome partitioning ATPase
MLKLQLLARAAAPGEKQRDPRVILVTSAMPGEGKTFVAHRLTASFGLDPRMDVTLIDGNFENPGLSNSSWSGYSAPGLLDCIDDGSDDLSRVAQSTGQSNVRIVLTGQLRDDAAEYLGSANLEKMLSSLLRSAHSYVIIDAGSVLSGGEASVFAQYSGNLAFVVEANQTRRASVAKALSVLDRVAGPLDEKSAGIVVNKTNSAGASFVPKLMSS